MDPQTQAEAGVRTPLKPTSVLMRRSIRVFEARQPKEGAAGTIALFCCSLFFSLILLAILNAVSIACIVIGIVYLDRENCPGEKNIAPVLIASGVLAIFLSIFEARSRVLVAKEGEITTEESPKKDCFDYVLNLTRLVKLGLFIYLCVLVFTLLPHVKYEPYQLPPEAVNYYCNATLFLFSYWLIIFVLVCLGLLVLFACCCCGCITLAAVAGSD